ncbi:unnamed protein product [Calypogeia fissa]
MKYRDSNDGLFLNCLYSAWKPLTGAGREEAEFNRNEIQQSILENDEPHANGAPDLFPSELETGQRGVGLERRGGQSEGLSRGEEGSAMLMDCSQSKGDATVGLGPIMGEENGVMDTAEMSFDSVVLPTLPAEGTNDAEGAPDEYAETLMSSPREREGELISTVSASPSTFFQATNMDVGASTMPASWEELRSAHAQSGYGTGPSSSDDASPGSGNSTEERAFVDSFCGEPLKADSLDMRNDQGLSGRAFEHGETMKTETLQSSGVSDMKNEDSSSPTPEDGSLGGEKGQPGPRPRKEKGPLGELSLRKVLSDPVTGTFLDDAMVAMCGHSFGSGSLQRVLETHSCMSCGASVPPKTLVPNFALRAAVLAYRHEDHVWQINSVKGTKRRREQFEMRESSEPKGASSDPTGSAENTHSDSRSKGVQFPFVVGEKVIIKQGNKRTPERFFGMEAVITNQCLNGWYLVRTLVTGESVRLQYRCLQKLGEADSPLTSEPRLSAEQQVDSPCRPLITDSPRGDPICTNPGEDLKYESPASRQQNDNVTSANPSGTAESLKVHFSEAESNGTLKKSIVAAAGEGCTTLDGCKSTDSSQEGGMTRNNLQVADGLSNPVEKTAEPDSTARETLESCDQETIDAGSQKRSADFMKSIDTLHGGPGLNRDTGAKVWVGTSMSYPEAAMSKNGQGLTNTGSSDSPGASIDGDKLPQVVSSQANGNEILRTRSKRSAVHLKSTPASGGFLQDSDPYRKVYTSGSRRRSTKEEPVIAVAQDHLPADSKPALKETENNGKVFEKPPAKSSSVGGLGTGKPGRDMKLRSANEILQIMRKDMLKLEERIPHNFLLRSWRVRRTKWKKQVQASHTVLELGELVRDFRYALLLTAAGGMSDEEWDMRISQIIESGDIGLLVPLWGRLCGDVHKWLESRPKGLPSKDIKLILTAEDLKQDPEGSGATVSSVQMTTAATLAAVDAVTEQDIDSSIKALLASTMRLVQQQSRSELSEVREALEWEKRHLTARLAHLEQRLTNLPGTSELNGLEDSPIHLTRASRSPPAEKCASPPIDQIKEGTAHETPLDSRQGYETEEFESDTSLPAQEADGEATDMSDSD